MERIHYFADNEFCAEGVISNGMLALKQLSDIKDEPLHDHDFVEIVYIHDGKGAHCIDGIEYPVQKGDLLYINYGCTHSFKVYERLIASNVMVKPEYFDKVLLNEENIFCLLALTSFEKIQAEIDKAKPLVSFQGKDSEEISLILERIETELSNNYIGKASVLNSYMNILFTGIFRKILISNNNNDEIIPTKIIEYIQAHCEERLTLKMLSQQCFYNPAYFSRLFKKAYNMTLTDFIMEQRLKKSYDLLRDSDLSIEEIIVECGFTDKTGFYNRFKEAYGCTPGEYRKSLKN